MDQETVKITALVAIFDLLHFFGLEAFKLETTTTAANDDDDDDKTSAATADTDDDSAPAKEADDELDDDDFDDLHSDASSQPQQQPQDSTDIGADILTILTDLLDSNVSRLVLPEPFVYLCGFVIFGKLSPYCRTDLSICPSVCVSICLSVTA